ncbi:phosphotransferase [Protaetiibacter mangrovi]|uniref:Phosphotransferase n=1 Tax=Protaetiibacter mangrovi TaxID=2970926 RepID=A0ABT1ZEC7_9MICO|nr:phosphotransferase [Protaetiibacter mangrovi]MCS0499030.1 phosphotransferase [Protaetiibacter mangrovi]TPX04819.1 phosphotransferase [Schumannella luteola]
MARSHLTLAALATSAVAELDVVGAAPFGSAGRGDFDAAVITGRDGRHWIVRVPRSERAEQQQSADLVALRALSQGVRARLPFEVTTFAGQTPVDGTRAVVSEFVYGTPVTLAGIDLALADSIGQAIAHLHALPTSLVTDAGLPMRTAVDAHRAALAIVDRAAATGLVPAALLQRWEQAGEDQGLWQYTPAVVNGDLGAGSFLASAGDVTGVLGWHALRVDDPARDLYWALGTRRDGIADAVFDAYTRVRGSVDRRLRQRATLLSELDVARWLLHGTEQRDTTIVDDAVTMLSRLVDERLGDATESISPPTLPILAVDEVEALLDRAERVS